MSLRISFVARFVVAAAIVACVMGAANLVSATTIGYWRFEDTPGFLLDSSGNNNTLTTVGTVTHATLPGSGPGSAFPTTVPNNLLANAKTSNIAGTSDSLQRTTISSIPTTQFTVESFVHYADSGNNNESPSNADCLFGLRAGSNLGLLLQIRTDGLTDSNGAASHIDGELWLSINNGTTGFGYKSGFLPEKGKDYYMATTFDRDGELKFYVKNLTDNTALQTFTVNHSFTGTINPAATFLEIGGYSNAAANFDFDGLMDEVRFSDVALSVDDLLITSLPPAFVPIPEPATGWLLGLGLVALRRRRVK